VRFNPIWTCADCKSFKRNIFKRILGVFFKKYRNYGYCEEQCSNRHKEDDMCAFFEHK